MPRRGGKRPLRPGEKALWQKVTDTVTPRPGAILPITDLSEEPKPAPSMSPRKRRAPPLPIALPKKTTPPEELPPAYEAGDPRQARHVARGRVEIDAELDLHGLTQEQARTRLDHFIEFASLRGNRVVLVITGKGHLGESRYDPFEEAPRGILRQRFLEWVERTPLRDRISSVRPSHQRHGGRGAFYVFLKTRKPARRL
ncbi:Smr/MutS family protein [Parvularcula marina]|uniref:Smr domain-containing protein n=1 Tax=Parvularcula marina TaxID=2292771 RepID=A0A371RJ15_9PROT|nr:Smr/MutS family protein [Parvularcula marina]RFB05442.1 hypothetical protein DX908_09340 [Parvularcula marina]